MVDYGASVKKPFLDIKNLIIGIVLSIIPIVRWFALGYALENTGLSKKKVLLNKSPAWTDWGKLFVRGLLATIISIIYFLPAIIILLIGVISAIGILISKVGWSVLMTGDSVAISQAFSQNWAALGPAIIAAVPFLVIGALLAILGAYLSPMAQVNFVNYDNFGKAFSLSEVFRKCFTVKYLAAWLLILVISIVLGFILNWIPWVGGGAAYFIGSVIGFSLYGQVYKEIKK